MKILFLYTELADYFLKCCEALAQKCEVHIIRWPLNNEAPFKFSYPAGISVYNKKDYDRVGLHELVKNINPGMIVCSGWVDKDYLAVTKKYSRKIPTVLTADTHWKGSLKQYLAIVLSRFFLLNTFSHAWVPGEAQRRYVKKLGFKNHMIRTGFYCCDLQKFNSYYHAANKRTAVPKRFLYVGRYYDFKGITDLWQAFTELQKEKPNEWELWCLGTGSIEPVKHPGIKHFGFVQPADLEPILRQTGVFVLPSRFEPWAVVVQEYAAAGYPLVLSEKVGAGEIYLREGFNGLSFTAGNANALKNALKKIINLSDKELLLMSVESHELAQANSPHRWAETAIEIYESGHSK